LRGAGSSSRALRAGARQCRGGNRGARRWGEAGHVGIHGERLGGAGSSAAIGRGFTSRLIQARFRVFSHRNLCHPTMPATRSVGCGEVTACAPVRHAARCRRGTSVAHIAIAISRHSSVPGQLRRAFNLGTQSGRRRTACRACRAAVYARREMRDGQPGGPTARRWCRRRHSVEACPLTRPAPPPPLQLRRNEVGQAALRRVARAAARTRRT